MAGTIIGFPKLPTPSQDVTVQYLSDLVRALETVIENLQNPGPQRGTNQTLTKLQADNDVGLEPGALYQVDGFVKIALADVAACAGSVGTGAIGTVTVAVS
mgnify:CR=1 FL=1